MIEIYIYMAHGFGKCLFVRAQENMSPPVLKYQKMQVGNVR